MLAALSDLQSFAFPYQRHAETVVFYMHCRLTFLMLMISTIIIATKQITGDRIHCMSSTDPAIRIPLLDDYCWAASTYSIRSAFFEGEKGPHPGIRVSEDDREYIYRNYYQYVYLILFLEGFIFYVPFLIWKTIDQSRLKKFYEIIDSKEDIECKGAVSSIDKAAIYIAQRLGTYKEYASSYISCEFIALVNLIVQSFFLNSIFDGQFFNLGLHYVFKYDVQTIFPLVTNCPFKRYGPGGEIDVVDALCVLPTNVFNEKIFLFVCVWFAVLFVFTVLDLLDLLLCCLIPRYRTICIRLKMTVLTCRVSESLYVKAIERNDFGDWFTLSIIKRSIDPVDFSKFMEKVWQESSTKKNKSKVEKVEGKEYREQV